MRESRILPIFCLLVLIGCRTEAKAYPHDSQEVAGISIGGLHTGLKTNLFSKNGPLDQLDKGISSGFSEISKGVRKVSKFMSQGSQEEIAGVNIAGLHAGIKTNLFSKHGPLAIIGNELGKGVVELHKDFEKGASEVASGVNDVANHVQSTLEGGVNLIAKGFEDLGKEQASSASSQESSEAKTHGGVKETITIVGKEGQPQVSGGRIIISGQTSPSESNSEVTSVNSGSNGAGRETITIVGKEGQPQGNSEVSSVNSGSSGVGKETITITGRESGQSQVASPSTSGTSRLILSGQSDNSNTQVTSGSEGGSGTVGGRATITVNGKESEQPQPDITSGTEQPSGQPESGRIRIHYLSSQNGQEGGVSGSSKAILGNLDGEGGSLIIKTIRESGGTVNAETVTELLKKMKLSEICKVE